MTRAERKEERLLLAVFVIPPFGDRGPAPFPASQPQLTHYYCRSTTPVRCRGHLPETGQPPLGAVLASLPIAEEKILAQSQARHVLLRVPAPRPLLASGEHRSSMPSWALALC